MPRDLTDLSTRKPRHEYVRLTGLDIRVPSDEQIEKADAAARAKGYDPIPPRVTLVVETEPLSYRIEGGTLGNKGVKYVEMTNGLKPEEIVAVRESGLMVLDDGAFIKATLGKPEDQRNLYARWISYWTKSGAANLQITDEGKPTTTSIGAAFEVLEGDTEFPAYQRNAVTGAWEQKGTKVTPFTQFFLRLAPDYVAPPMEERRLVTIRTRDEQADAAVSAALGTGANFNTVLREAALASGLVGMNAKQLASNKAQMKFCDDVIGSAPVFLSDDVAEAAQKGELLIFLTAHEAITVGEDGVIS